MDSLQQSAEAPSRIKLDVGGVHFSTTIQTLTNIPNTFFTTMFNGRWNVEVQEDGSVFIDRDPLPFHDIINFMRDYPMINLKVSLLSQKELDRMYIEARFYQIEPLVRHLNWSTYRLFSNIISYEQELLLELCLSREKSLTSWFSWEDPHVELLHRGSENGFQMADFELRPGPGLLYLIRSSKEHIFGAYMYERYTYGSFRERITALFSLVNPAGLPPRLCTWENGGISIHQTDHFFQFFKCIEMAPECNINPSTFKIPNYIATQGIDNTFCDGSQTFLVADFEMWKIDPGSSTHKPRNLSRLASFK